jgi:hypothetical protein
VTIRKRPTISQLDRVINRLPARFLNPTVAAGTVTSLRDYIRDLTEHLSLETGISPDRIPTIDVMESLGIPPSEWYRALLTNKNG